ncbi:hypothetical protein CRUP_022572 [Coryphaenoides rupestris]|nr:hypothetical protein CRUP_022572 [Coryphaenoides rupestris]
MTVCFTYANIFRICRQHTREISERHARYRPQGGVVRERGVAEPTQVAHLAQHQRLQQHPSALPPATPPCPDKRYAVVLFRITSVFYILWLPYILYFLLESGGVYQHATASFLTTWLAISNSFCNCLIYSLSNSAFRKGLKRLCSVCVRRGVTGSGLGSRNTKKASSGPAAHTGPGYGYGPGEIKMGTTCHV